MTHSIQSYGKTRDIKPAEGSLTNSIKIEPHESSNIVFQSQFESQIKALEHDRTQYTDWNLKLNQENAQLKDQNIFYQTLNKTLSENS